MFKQLKFVAGLVITAALVACGGGGDSSGGGDTVSVGNPLAKYEGTYYACDLNERDIVSITATGSSQLKISTSTEVYSGVNCTGNVIGTYKPDAAATISFLDTTSAALPAVTILPSSSEVDRVRISNSLTTAKLTGSNVTDNCVRYSLPEVSGNTCFELVVPELKLDGALYLTADNQYLVTLYAESGALTAGKILSRSTTFNLASLQSSSTARYAFKDAIINYPKTSQTKFFEVTGTIAGKAVTGSGSMTFSDFSPIIFQGQSAFVRTMSQLGSINIGGQTTPLNSSSSLYYDSGNRPLAISGFRYEEFDATSLVTPETVKINDKGALFTSKAYTDSTKTTLVRTTQISYSVSRDTGNLALITLTETRRDAQDFTEEVVDTIFIAKPNETPTLVRIASANVGKNTYMTLNFK